jgi:hypothetical protein
MEACAVEAAVVADARSQRMPYWKGMYEHALAELNDIRAEREADQRDRYQAILSPCQIHTEQLPGCVRCLVRDKDAFRAEVQRLENNERFFGAQAVRLEGRIALIARLLTEVQRYLDHQRGCLIWTAPNVPCSCGYAQLIARLGQATA